MSRILPVAGAAFTSLLVAACYSRPDAEPAPVHWILQDWNATGQTISYHANKPRVYYASQYARFTGGFRLSGKGVLTHSSELGDLPRHIQIKWTVNPSALAGGRTRKGWYVDDIHPYELIPAEVIERARGYNFRPSPLLISITMLPEGRLRFSWHACADASCQERGDPDLQFDAHHEFQGAEFVARPESNCDCK